MRTDERRLRAERQRELRAEELELEQDFEEGEDSGGDEAAGAFSALLADRRKLLGGLAVVVLLVFAIYVVFPKLVGLDDAVRKLDNAVWYWIVIAIAFNVLAFVAYVALFRGILGGTRDDLVHRRLNLKASYQITMAGLAATRIFSAAGAGGIVLTYWALRKAGMPRRRSACRMVAFMVLTYGVYTVALVVVRDPAAHPRPAGRRPLRRHGGPGDRLGDRNRRLPADRPDPATTSSGASRASPAATGALVI